MTDYTLSAIRDKKVNVMISGEKHPVFVRAFQAVIAVPVILYISDYILKKIIIYFYMLVFQRMETDFFNSIVEKRSFLLAGILLWSIYYAYLWIRYGNFKGKE